jgi:large subunit ribosomal protein L6
MSRIGRMPIPVPSGVEVDLAPGRVKVSGPKGTLERPVPEEMEITEEDGQLLVTRPSDSREHRSLHGLTRTLVANMVVGVTEEFVKNLEIHGVGYRAILRPQGVELALGFSRPVEFRPPKGVTIEVPAPNRLVIRGADKEAVGQAAANIRALRKPDPYKQKGIRYAGEHIRKKAGKASK